MDVSTTGTFIGWFGVPAGRPAVTTTVAEASLAWEESLMRTE
ncbi:hypothetical protein GCM10022223_08710 [Kineosporia mesophila]|uniref:Uncharacterized protein n=1 Tax=Kineosporia mesophila TaxID=566012 RepID=A0ABP6Z1D4_9ACTN